MDRKYLDEIRTEELIEETKNRLNKKEPVVFKGTTAEWNALTEEEKSVYSMRCFTDGSGGEIVDNYSTVETKTNKVWIDGKPIYRKVIDNIPFPEEADIAQEPNHIAMAQLDITSAFPNIGTIVSTCIRIIDKSSGAEFTCPRNWQTTSASDGSYMIVMINASITISDNTVTAEVTSNRKAWNNSGHKCRAIVEYTKTTD